MSTVIVGDDGAQTTPVTPGPDTTPDTAGGQHTPTPAADPEPAPNRTPGTQRADTDETGQTGGLPAGQLALGGAAVLAVGGTGIYHAAGLPGLAAAGAAVVAGGYAVYRLRHRKSRTHTGGDGSGSGGRHGGTSLGSLGRSRRGSAGLSLGSLGGARRVTGTRAGGIGLLGGDTTGRRRRRGGDGTAHAGHAATRTGGGARTGRAAANGAFRHAGRLLRWLWTLGITRKIATMFRRAFAEPAAAAGEDADEPAAPTPGEPTPETTDETDPPPADTTDPEPTRRVHRRIDPRIGAAPMNPLAAHAQEMAVTAADYSVQSMMTVKGHMETLREYPLACATALRVWAEALHAHYPLNQPVLEILQQLYEGFAELVPIADEAATIFNTSHAADIARHEAPRTGEEKWNV